MDKFSFFTISTLIKKITFIKKLQLNLFHLNLIINLTKALLTFFIKF